jgi:1-phosphofructokinase family hexose kinase
MIATITLNPSIDQNLVVRGLVKDDANRAQDIYRYPGGKGLNVSKVVRELGGPTKAWALVGGFSGEAWREGVKKMDIDFHADSVSGETRVNTVITDLKDNTQTRVSAPGPHISEKTLELFLNKLVRVRPKPAYWALGGSLARGMRADTYRHFIERIQKKGIPCVLDTDDDALKEGVKARPYLIKPNEYEMERLLGHRLKSIRDYTKAARSLAQKGIKIVIVSLGAKGALYVTAAEAFHAHGIRVPVKSKVGAGDSLIGGTILSLYRGKGLHEAARLGIAASASAVMREAPRLCDRKDIPGLLRKVRLERLN